MDLRTEVAPQIEDPGQVELAATPPAEQRTEANLLARLKALRERHRKKEMLLFFLGGFCFDLLLVERIDSSLMLIHQGSYLVLLSALLVVDHHYHLHQSTPSAGFWARVLHFRHEMIHFLFGTLLNAFLVFYFKASSGVVAFGFMLALGAVLVANEMPRFRRLGPPMRVALHGFALTSYLAYLLPQIAGFLSPYLFVLAACASAAVSYVLWRVSSKWTPNPGWTFGRAVVPSLAVQGFLLLLYFLHVVPPVPLSLKWIGIYHQAQREGDRVRVAHQRPWWRIWEHGDEIFLARPGDRVFCVVRIFAPRKFRDGVKIRWAYEDSKAGWVRTDAIPLTITGGQDEGWRGIAYKRNFAPGRWKVQVETEDEREVGSIRFAVVEDRGTEPRNLIEELR